MSNPDRVKKLISRWESLTNPSHGKSEPGDGGTVVARRTTARPQVGGLAPPQPQAQGPKSPRGGAPASPHWRNPAASTTTTPTLAPTPARTPAPAPTPTPAPHTDPAPVTPQRERKLEYGLHGVQGKRSSMEDRHCALLELPNNPHYAFFGVYDGHAGEEAADFVAEKLHRAVDTEISCNDDLKKAVIQACETVDEDFIEEGETMMWYSGTTVICALIEKKNKHIHVANLGDSRCVLSRSGTAVCMSTDHKPTVPSEQERIEKAGYNVIDARIDGTHAMSRAIGDAELKGNLSLHSSEQAISNMPEFTESPITKAEEFLVLACDGLWDVMGNQQAVDYISERFNKGESVQSIAEQLANHAVEIGSTDNVSVCIVTLE